MIQLEIDETKLIDEDYVKDIVSKIMFARSVEGEKTKIDKCFDYYDGKAPLIEFDNPRGYTPRVINITKHIVDTATQTFIGVLPDIVSSEGKKKKNNINNFFQRLYNRDFGNHFYETCKYASKVGSGYIAIYNEVGDTFPRFKALNPKFAECVYDCSLSRKHVLSYYITEVNDNSPGGVSSKYIIYVYTNKYIYAFESPKVFLNQSTIPDSTKQITVAPYLCWNSADDKRLSRVEHNFNGIPVIEIPNNEEYKGDAECVFDLIALYNALQNNRCKNVNDVVNYLLMLKNVRIGTEEEQKSAVSVIKNNNLLLLEGENVDAKFLTNPLNQEELQTLANNIDALIQRISRVPDLSSVDFSQNASDPIIKIKTKPLLDLCGDKEKKCSEPYKKVLRMVLDWCKSYDKDYDEIDFNLDKTKIIYSHVLPSNDIDMVTAITNLQNSKMANPEVLLQQLSFIQNVNEYVEGMNVWNEKVDKAKTNNNNSGVNQHNIDKHNETPITRNQMDNKRNFNEGNAGVIEGQNQ